MKVPYLTESHIEARADDTIARFERRFGCFEESAVPLEEIAECLFDLDVRCEDLNRTHGGETLGAIWFEKCEIRIDETLNHETHPGKLGRYRFTLAHEIGHWVLHEPVHRARRRQSSLFEDTSQPSIICRAPLPRTKKEPVEWQADYFAGCLTMPRTLVMRAFENIKGSRAPYIATNEIAFLQARQTSSQATVPTLSISREIADALQTSAQATQYRLIALGLILTDQPAPQLLTPTEIEATYIVPEPY